MVAGMIAETFIENTETLAGTTEIITIITATQQTGTTEIIIITTATHRVQSRSITVLVGPSTEFLITGASVRATHRNSTGTQSTISTDTGSKHRWTENLITAGIISRSIKGISFVILLCLSIYKANSLGCIPYWLPFVFRLLGLVKIFL